MSKYIVQAHLEGVLDLEIEETFQYRFMAFRAAKYALKRGLIVRIMKQS